MSEKGLPAMRVLMDDLRFIGLCVCVCGGVGGWGGGERERERER